MANVMFKRGSQSSLNTLINGTGDRFVDGAFYLTTDTDRLYVAQSASELVELNKSITVVNAINDLPKTDVELGQFYYVSGSNILCIYTTKDGTNQWVQINPDTDTNDYVSGFSITKKEIDTDGNLVYNYSLTQKNKAGEVIAGKGIAGTFTIAKADIATLGGIEVDVGASAPASNATTIKTSGAGSKGNGFTITGAGGVTIGGTANAITISSKDDDSKYALSSAAGEAKVTLSGSATANGEKQSVTFVGDDTWISTSGATAGEVKISHSGPGTAANTYGPTAAATIDAAARTFTVPNIGVDSKGHVASASNITYTLPPEVDTKYQITNVTAGNDGAFSVTLKNNNG